MWRLADGIGIWKVGWCVYMYSYCVGKDTTMLLIMLLVCHWNKHRKFYILFILIERPDSWDEFFFKEQKYESKSNLLNHLTQVKIAIGLVDTTSFIKS